MPELIINLALLSGSLHIFSFGDERLRCGAEQIRKLCLGALYQPLSGCIRLPCPGALDPVCDPTTLTPFPFSFLSPCPKLLPTCPPPHSCCGPPASRPACRGRGPWCHGSLQWTQPPRHEQRDPSGGQGSEVELHPASLQTLQLACTLPAGDACIA